MLFLFAFFPVVVVVAHVVLIPVVVSGTTPAVLSSCLSKEAIQQSLSAQVLAVWAAMLDVVVATGCVQVDEV